MFGPVMGEGGFRTALSFRREKSMHNTPLTPDSPETYTARDRAAIKAFLLARRSRWWETRVKLNAMRLQAGGDLLRGQIEHCGSMVAAITGLIASIPGEGKPWNPNNLPSASPPQPDSPTTN